MSPGLPPTMVSQTRPLAMPPPTALPLVTVVVPARDEQRDITGALTSVLVQDYPLERLEVVVVTAGSTDATPDIATSVLSSAGLRRWSVLREGDGSTPGNLNVALAWAAGEMVIRVDARSRIPSAYVRRCVELLLQRPDIAVVGGRQVAVAPRAGAHAEGIARGLNNRYAMGLSRYRRPGAPSGATDTVYLGAFRTGQLRAAGGWDRTMSTNQDFDLNRRLSSNGTIWFEAGLAVEYIPRSSVRDLARQYHRFGRWKVRYWSQGREPPQFRQVVLLTVPALTGGALAVVAAARPAALVPLAAAAAVSVAVIDEVGASERAGPRSRMWAAAAMAAVAGGWLTGVAREGVTRVVR